MNKRKTKQGLRRKGFKHFVKIDEEDIEVYEKCVCLTPFFSYLFKISMLLAAGYFRARILDLSPFDKIVGGLCWCITNSNILVDVGNIYFHEEPTLGQKAAISDSITRSLRRMKCPVRVQSVQILGLDLKVIFLVLQWLIKMVFETREENKELIKKYSNLLFLKNYLLEKDKELFNSLINSKSFLDDIRDSYESKRRFKIRQKESLKREKRNRKKRKKFNWDYVQSVLLEYGREFHFLSLVKKNKKDEEFGSHYNPEQKEEYFKLKSQKEEEKRHQTHQIKINKLKKKMKITQEQSEFNIKKDIINKYVFLQNDEISKLNMNFEEYKKNLKNEIDVEQNVQILHNISKKKYLKQIDNLKKEFLEKKKKLEKLANNVKKQQENFETLKKTNETIKTKIEKFNEKLDNLNEDERSILNTLRSLIELNENLKKQETKFRIQCKQQLDFFNTEIKVLENHIKNFSSGSSKDDTYEKIEKLKRLCDKKFENLQNKLLKENKKLKLFERNIDEIPISAELNQYTKRLSELIHQIVKNDKETRKFFDSYNTSSRSFEYTEKKFSLFSQILEKYEKSLKVSQKNYSTWVLESVKKSSEQVKLSKDVVSKKKQDVNVKLDEKDKIYGSLIMEKRDYFRTLKKFEDEISKNKDLNEKVKKMELLIIQKQNELKEKSEKENDVSIDVEKEEGEDEEEEEEGEDEEEEEGEGEDEKEGEEGVEEGEKEDKSLGEEFGDLILNIQGDDTEKDEKEVKDEEENEIENEEDGEKEEIEDEDDEEDKDDGEKEEEGEEEIDLLKDDDDDEDKKNDEEEDGDEENEDEEIDLLKDDGEEEETKIGDKEKDLLEDDDDDEEESEIKEDDEVDLLADDGEEEEDNEDDEEEDLLAEEAE